MKRLFVVFACLVCASVIKGQDIITFADGTEVQAKVIEVGISEITYKLYEYPDGPSYIRNRNEIQKITYENGQRQLFGSAIQNYLKSGTPGIIAYNSKTAKATIDGANVADERLQQYFSADDYKLFQNGRTLYTSGTVIGTIGAIPFGWCLGGMLAGAEVNTAVLLGGAAAMVGGMAIAFTGQNKMKKAISNYNTTLSLAPTVTWSPINPDPAPALALRLTF